MTNGDSEGERPKPRKTPGQEFREILDQSMEQFTGPVRDWSKQLVMGWGAVPAATVRSLAVSMAVNGTAITPMAILPAAAAATIFGAATAYGTAFFLWSLRQTVRGRTGRRK